MLTKAEILIVNPDLNSFRVVLKEAQKSQDTVIFDCYATDETHAIEQAGNAYPGCKTLSVIYNCGNDEADPTDTDLYVIYSDSEAKSSDDNAGFWNNQSGWTIASAATRFTLDETTYLNLPTSLDGDTHWTIAPTADKPRQWFTMTKSAEIHALGEHLDNVSASKKADTILESMWVFDEETARHWVNTLNSFLNK